MRELITGLSGLRHLSSLSEVAWILARHGIQQSLDAGKRAVVGLVTPDHQQRLASPSSQLQLIDQPLPAVTIQPAVGVAGSSPPSLATPSEISGGTLLLTDQAVATLQPEALSVVRGPSLPGSTSTQTELVAAAAPVLARPVGVVSAATGAPAAPQQPPLQQQPFPVDPFNSIDMNKVFQEVRGFVGLFFHRSGRPASPRH
jgi:hypothetical protein